MEARWNFGLAVGRWRTLESRAMDAGIDGVHDNRYRECMSMMLHVLDLPVRIYTILTNSQYTPPSVYASSKYLWHGLEMLPDLRALRCPARAREAEPVAYARVRDVADTSNGLELREVNQAAIIQHVVAEMEVLDETEHQRRRLISGLRVDDIYGPEKLRSKRMLGCKSLYAREGAQTDLAFHAECALLDSGCLDVDLRKVGH